jgi:hypothetical protein
LAFTFAGFFLCLIDDAAQLTSLTTGSEDLPLMPFSLPHRLVSVGGDPFRENNGGELQFSARHNTRLS